MLFTAETILMCPLQIVAVSFNSLRVSECSWTRLFFVSRVFMKLPFFTFLFKKTRNGWFANFFIYLSGGYRDNIDNVVYAFVLKSQGWLKWNAQLSLL